MLPFQKKKKLRALHVLTYTNALILLAGAMLGPIYALFVEEIGGNLLDASIAGTIFALAAGITVLFSGRFTDRIKHPEYIVLFGYACIGLGFLGFAFVNSLWSLFAIQALIGFGEAIYSPAFDAIYTKNILQNNEGSGWALWESMYYFTSAAGAIIGGYIAYTFGFQNLFFSMSLLCVFSITYLLFYRKKHFFKT